MRLVWGYETRFVVCAMIASHMRTRFERKSEAVSVQGSGSSLGAADSDKEVEAASIVLTAIRKC